MPWFENKQQKQLRLHIEKKLQTCLAKPDRYSQAIAIIQTHIRKSNQSVIQMVVDRIKEVIKDQDKSLKQKYQAILLLKDLMQTHNNALGKYVVKKILKRLLIFAKHKQYSKDEDRGRDIFGKCKKQSQQKYGINFLNTLLLAFQDWGTKWPKNVDGPFQQFHGARNQLLISGIQFPKQRKKQLKQSNFTIQNKNKNKNVPKRKSTEINPLPPKQQTIKTQPIPKQIQNYLLNLNQILKLFINLMQQNPQFSEMWEIIKQVVDNIRQQIKKGDAFIAQLLAQQKDNSVLYEKFQKNSQFLKNLQMNMKTVDKNNHKYSQFCFTQIKQSKKMINRILLHLKNNQSMNSSQLKTKKESSVSKPKLQEFSQKYQQKQQKEKPKIKPRNRFDSTTNLQHQLQIIKKQKQQFNSGSLSQQSGKFGSIPGVMYDKARFVGINNNKEQKIQKKKVLKSIAKITQKNQSIIQPTSRQNLQKSTNKNQQIFSLSHVKKVTQHQQKNDQDFDQFDKFQNNKQKSLTKQKKQEESSDFFKQQQKKQVRQRDRKKKVTQKQNDNFFDIVVKSKEEESKSFSVFGKQQQQNKQQANSNQPIQQQQQQQQINGGQPITFNFNTFKNNQQLVIQSNIKKQQNYDSNTEDQHQRNQAFDKVKKNQVNIFQSKNPFSQKSVLQFSQKSISNPFDQKSISNKSENPFEKSIHKSQNPFQKSIIKEDNKSINGKQLSKQDNPFQRSLNKIQSQNAIEKSGLNSFDKSAFISQNPFNKSEKKSETNPFQTNKNPFEQNTQQQNDKSINQMYKSPTFEIFQKSLSKKSSFNNINKDQIQKRPDIQFVNPFDTLNHQIQNSNAIANVDTMRESGPQFINVQQHNKQTTQLKNSFQLVPKQYVRQSIKQSMHGFRGSFGIEKSSVKGFDFDDFDNFNRSSRGQKNNKFQRKVQNRNSKLIDLIILLILEKLYKKIGREQKQVKYRQKQQRIIQLIRFLTFIQTETSNQTVTIHVKQIKIKQLTVHTKQIQKQIEKF